MEPATYVLCCSALEELVLLKMHSRRSKGAGLAARLPAHWTFRAGLANKREIDSAICCAQCSICRSSSSNSNEVASAGTGVTELLYSGYCGEGAARWQQRKQQLLQRWQQQCQRQQMIMLVMIDVPTFRMIYPSPNFLSILQKEDLSTILYSKSKRERKKFRFINMCLKI